MRMTMSGPVDPQELRTLPVGEVAIRLLRQLAKGRVTSSNDVFRGAEQAYQYNDEPDVGALLERLSDAWAWLVAHGLLGPAPHQTGDWMRLTRWGRDVASRDDAVVVVQAEDRLSFELHPLLEAKVRPVFMLGDYETAAFAAMKQVEVRVRELSGEVADVVGVALMRKAFGERGPLTDQEAPRGEQVAVMDLFAGAIGTVKNPASHRTVDYDDPAEAAEAVLMADLLMRMVDRVERRAG